MIKVGAKYETPKGLRTYTYRDIEFKEDWADAKEYLPEDYDLVTALLSTGKTIPAWTYGKTWEGLYIKPEHEVIAWKRRSYEYV